MSEFYKNALAKNLMKRIEKDYTFSMHRIASEKRVPISHKDIVALDNIISLEKTNRPESLKQVFVELTARES